MRASVLLFLILSVPCFGNTVELHSHLFMKAGLGWLFRGTFEGPIRAQSWSDRFSSQANAETLEASGDSIVVVALYAHPILLATEFKSVKDAIREEVGEARDFVATHPNWIIARSSEEASRGISVGKKILILSLEGAAGTLDSDADLEEFIDRDGIRIVTFLHLTDDDLGGAAFLRGIRAWSSPWAFMRSWFHPHAEAPGGPPRNSEGLTPEGKTLLEKLLARHVWIDLSHSSDESQAAMIPILQSRKLPLLYTHTVLRRYFQAERAISDDQLESLTQSQGILGLIPSEEMLEGTPAVPCPEGIAKLAFQFKEVAAKLGAASVDFGTDFNGALTRLKPGCEAAPSLRQTGLVTMAQTPAVWSALKELGAPIEPEKSVSKFLETWKKIENAKN